MSFLAGFKLREKEICLFSFDTTEGLTPQDESMIEEAINELMIKVNENHETLWEVFDVHTRLVAALQPKIDVDMERPLHVGVEYIIHSIKLENVPVTSYFRRKDV
jgi:hypothetical protein